MNLHNSYIRSSQFPFLDGQVGYREDPSITSQMCEILQKLIGYGESYWNTDVVRADENVARSFVPGQVIRECANRLRKGIWVRRRLLSLGPVGLSFRQKLLEFLVVYHSEHPCVLIEL